jgi:uroporphyrinogen-III synthase
MGGMPSFQGRRVLALESRRAVEMAALITTYGGQAMVAPALREVPLESNTEALDFAGGVMRGSFDVVIFLTGVGARALVSVVEAKYPRQEFLAALARSRVVVRGPKPLAVLRELKVPVWVIVPEPNTWRELLAAIDDRGGEWPLRGSRVAVQEYGVSNPELLAGLRDRGAEVVRVPVYRWALPEDVAPLRNAVVAIAHGDIDAVIFTTGVQVVHLWQIVTEMELEREVRSGLARAMIVSIGPSTSDELRRHGLAVDLEPSHPKIGFLVREAAERSAAVLTVKRRL